jgi:hypothetical protein
VRDSPWCVKPCRGIRGAAAFTANLKREAASERMFGTVERINTSKGEPQERI